MSIRWTTAVFAMALILGAQNCVSQTDSDPEAFRFSLPTGWFWRVPVAPNYPGMRTLDLNTAVLLSPRSDGSIEAALIWFDTDATPVTAKFRAVAFDDSLRVYPFQGPERVVNRGLTTCTFMLPPGTLRWRQLRYFGIQTDSPFTKMIRRGRVLDPSLKPDSLYPVLLREKDGHP